MICRSFRECFIVDVQLREPDIAFWKVLKKCFFESGILALVLMRVSQWLYQKKVVWRIAPFVKRLNEVFTGFECHLKATIGEGLFIPHTQNLVIGQGVRIGNNVTLYNGVTLGAGARDADDLPNRYPIIEAGSIIYTGAKVLGPITVGANTVIGANAVVLCDVPAGLIAVGVPAKVLVPKNTQKND